MLVPMSDTAVQRGSLLAAAVLGAAGGRGGRVPGRGGEEECLATAAQLVTGGTASGSRLLSQQPGNTPPTADLTLLLHLPVLKLHCKGGRVVVPVLGHMLNHVLRHMLRPSRYVPEKKNNFFVYFFLWNILKSNQMPKQVPGKHMLRHVPVKHVLVRDVLGYVLKHMPKGRVPKLKSAKLWSLTILR